MTPTSPLAGLLTGLLDGLVVAAVILLVVNLVNRRHAHRAPSYATSAFTPVDASESSTETDGDTPHHRIPDAA